MAAFRCWGLSANPSCASTMNAAVFMLAGAGALETLRLLERIYDTAQLLGG